MPSGHIEKKADAAEHQGYSIASAYSVTSLQAWAGLLFS